MGGNIVNIQEILARLERNGGRFPRLALGEAVAAQSQITPELLSIIEYARQNVEKVREDGGYIAHLYAMYLLAQFRDERAYPALVDFFSIPGEFPLDATGDVVTEDLSRILASVSHGDTSLMERLAENEEADEYVRAAALDGMVISVAHGEKPREEVIAYFQSLFRGKLRREPSHAWSALVNCSADLHPAELLDDIKQAFEDHLVDESFVDLPWIEEMLERDREQVLKNLREDKRYGLIDNVISEMQGWACFDVPESAVPHVGRKIGRNEPCPCRSGKKYKRCCGRF
jgi:hypothetical protein